MHRSRFLIALILGAALVSGCATNQSSRSAQASGVIAEADKVHHIVLIWLKEPGNERHKQAIIAQARAFDTPGLLDVVAGDSVPAERAVADDSFDLCLVFAFESLEALRAYEADPVHRRAIQEKLLPVTERILVFDMRERRP